MPTKNPRQGDGEGFVDHCDDHEPSTTPTIQAQRAIEHRLTDDMVLCLRPGSRIEQLSRLSLHELLRHAGEVLAAALAEADLIDDWLARAVDRTAPDSTADTDDLFESYRSFLRNVGARPDDWQPFGRFAAALSARGLAPRRVRDGRVLRRGCRLLDQLPARPARAIALDHMARFLAERCEIGELAVGKRVRSSVFYSEYSEWALAQGTAPLAVKSVSDAMLRRGFAKITSNGRWWIGIQMLDRTAPADLFSSVETADLRANLAASGTNDEAKTGSSV